MKLLGVWYEGEECCNELKYMSSHSNIKCSTKLNMDIRYSFSIYVMIQWIAFGLVVYRVVYLADCLYFICISISLTSHLFFILDSYASIAIPELMDNIHTDI